MKYIVKIILCLSIISLIFNIGCISNNNDENIPKAKLDEIEVTIAFSHILKDEHSTKIILNVSIKNIADDKRKIIDHLYTFPSENNYYTIIANGTEYRENTGHDDGSFDDYSIIDPGKSFNFQFEITVEDKWDGIYAPFNISVNSYLVFIEIPVYSPLREYKSSNTIEIDRELIISDA